MQDSEAPKHTPRVTEDGMPEFTFKAVLAGR